MPIVGGDFVNSELSKPTSIFGLKLWVVIGICTGAFIVLFLFLLSLCVTSRRRNNRAPQSLKGALAAAAAASATPIRDRTPPISKEIPEVVAPPTAASAAAVAPPPAVAEIQIDIGKPEHRVVFADYLAHHKSRTQRLTSSSAGTTSGESHRSAGAGYGDAVAAASAAGGVGVVSIGGHPPEVSHLGWGHWYTLRELEEATAGFAPENVIGEGGYGIVYRGVLADNTVVAVKNLLNNRGQAEREFKVEVEAIGRVRHKNLVRLLGYCVEGAYRMLVYEYVDNGNLDQWIHGDVGDVSPLTWEIRMNIILGTAKGLAYLHEGLEPKVVHRDVKSSNILIDKQWNAKVSDFGLAKLLCSETNHVTTRVMGTFGYVAPEYASTGMLNERSDIYSFGVLIMEILSGRSPVDYNRPQDEIHLIEWLKTIVGERRSEEVLDPKIPEKPSPKALKRALLVALRCVDPDARKRPKIGHVIHMLEMDDLLYRDDQKVSREDRGSQQDYSGRRMGRHNLNNGGEIHGHRENSWR